MEAGKAQVRLHLRCALKSGGIGWKDAEETMMVITIVLCSGCRRGLCPDQYHHPQSTIRTEVSAVYLGESVFGPELGYLTQQSLHLLGHSWHGSRHPILT